MKSSYTTFTRTFQHWLLIQLSKMVRNEDEFANSFLLQRQELWDSIMLQTSKGGDMRMIPGHGQEFNTGK